MNTIWEERYAAGGNGGSGWRYEFLDLMRYVAETDRTLELGCGPGVNIQQFLNMPTDYYGVDGSETAIASARKAYPFMREKLLCLDFTHQLPFEDQSFDLICERASIAHNDLDAIRRAVDQVLRLLRPGSIFIGCDWFSIGHSEFPLGWSFGDGGATRNRFTAGQFKDAGTVHFSSQAELEWVFENFDTILLQERITRYPEGTPRPHWVRQDAGSDYQSAVWDIVCRKPLV